MKRVYLDYAASTPVNARVEKFMRPYFGGAFGNPGSLHSFGQEAVAAVDAARETIARALCADFREIIFTSSATEANNLALYAAYTRFAQLHPSRSPKIIISAIEHESVIEPTRFLAARGGTLAVIPVSKNGIVDLKCLAKELDENTCVVSIMHGNNEIGAIQPLREIADIISEFRSASQTKAHPSVRPPSSLVFHADAAQTFGWLEYTPQALGVDLMTLSAQKIYGPKGAGALYAARALFPLAPLIRGGGQEFGARSGTENVPAIAGFGKAVELIEQKKDVHAKKTAELKNYFWKEIKKMHPKAQINGINQLPHILNTYLPGHSAADIVMKLDVRGIAVSSGSACSARSMQPSYVIEALGHSKERAAQSVRFSFGRPTTKQEVQKALEELRTVLQK